MDLSKDSAKLLAELTQLHNELRDHTLNKYQRMNPFYEDIFNWKERGKTWTGHDNVTIYNSATLSGKVSIGENSWIGPFCSLDGGPVGLTIGKNCSISAACHIYTHDTVKWALSMGKCDYEYQPTYIGDGCFIGTGSIIIKGVTLGNQCLIAANSTVTKSFKNNAIIAGSPARQIGNVEVKGNEVTLHYY